MMRPFVYQGTGLAIDEDAARDYIRNGYLLSPRTVLKGRTKLPQLIRPISVDLNKIPSFTEKALESAMGQMAGTYRTVMFSGGFDSLLMCLLAKRCGAKVAAVTIRFEDFNPMTVQGSVESAERMKIEHHILNVNAVEFLSAFEALSGITDEPVFDLDLAVVYAALKKYDRQVAGEVLISGMGSDQWFGNEALEKTPGLEVRLDWASVAEAAHQKAAQAYGLKFIFPFLSEPLIAMSQSIPDAMKKDKQLLRALAVADAIPHRKTGREIQVPDVMRHILIKTYGHRAWPSPIPTGSRADHQTLRRIILGLWLEKAKGRMVQKSASL